MIIRDSIAKNGKLCVQSCNYRLRVCLALVAVTRAFYIAPIIDRVTVMKPSITNTAAALVWDQLLHPSTTKLIDSDSGVYYFFPSLHFIINTVKI